MTFSLKSASLPFTRKPLLALAFGLAATLSLPSHADDSPNESLIDGAVYAMTNSTAGNAVIVYNRAKDGSLSQAGSFATGGLGFGSGLGSQGSVKLSDGGRWLFAVNAGSNELSIFSVDRLGLILTDKVASGGTKPVSVAIHGDLVYVLNASSDSVSAFRLDWNGKLTPVEGSTQTLVGGTTGAAQIEFSPDGATLVATEKATNQILVYPVGDDGLLGPASSYAAATSTPFGFGFGRKGEFFVSEANGGQTGLSTLAAYRLTGQASAKVVNPSAATYQTAACWVAVTGNGRWVYTANPGSATISGFTVSPTGTLSLLSADGLTASTGVGAVDMAMDRGSQHLYAVSPSNGTISAFTIGADGALTPVQTLAAGLPKEAYGLAAQ